MKKFLNQIIQKILLVNLYMNFQKKFDVNYLVQKMLKGTKLNFLENYENTLSKIKDEHIKNKEDVKISEAFEIYMLKNFFKINLNKIVKKF